MGLGDLSPDDAPSGHETKRKYSQPTKQEFEECLFSAKEDVEWSIDMKAPGLEYVYDCHDFLPDHNGIVLRVYSTIDKRTGRARSKDSDAIRLVVFNRHVMRPMGGRVKTLRIETYCKNLTEKIQDIFEEYEQYVNECPECGRWMVIREGKYGEFLGCTGYPDCDHTEEVE